MPGLDAFYDISVEVSHLNNELMRAATSNQQGLKSFGPGRIVTLYDTHFHGNLAVILRPVRSSVNSGNMTPNANLSQRSFWVLALVTPDTLAGAQGKWLLLLSTHMISMILYPFRSRFDNCTSTLADMFNRRSFYALNL
jgi:hypothetical protein